MKKLTLLGLAFALLVGATLVPPTTAAAAAPQGAQLVSSVLSNMERNRRSLKSLRANIIVQKVDARFGEEMSEGSVQYVPGAGRDANVRVDFTRPRQEVLAVKNGQYVYFRPRMNTAYKGRSNNAPNKSGSLLSFVFNASGAQLRNEFNVELAGQGTLYDGGPNVVMLKLTPKGGADFRFAEIWVDGNGMPVQTRITERNGDSTLVRLVNIQKNARISPDVFNVPLPSGVKVINS